MIAVIVPMVVVAIVVVVVLGAPKRAAAYVGEVDLGVACDQQYPGQERELVLREEGNPYTWSCVSPTGEQGGIEVSEECARLYGAHVYGRVGTAGAASWVCVTDSRQPTGASSSSTTSASESAVPTFPANTT